MQRPRRTTELIEAPDTATKRTGRSKVSLLTGPSPIPGTSKKFLSRQSRTVRGSFSQDNNSLFLQVPGPSIAFGRVTPQKVATPSTKAYTASKKLFSTEKRSVANGSSSSQPSGPLHNDKKWVQEQSEAILEFLGTNCKPGEIAGLSDDFFSKSSGLKTMSIKQFVGIINYFLRAISGNRLIVGTNHVEDIVNILQKLNYPHQINKSCLKTPNTQHSFGNVIMILSFLMDLVPPQICMDEGYLFEFQEPENTFSSLTDTLLKADGEILAKLMRDSSEGWNLWNEQLNDEFAFCEERSCNFFIERRCGLKNLKELDEDIQRLKNHLKNLRESKPVLPTDLDQLHKEMRYFQTELKEKRQQVESEENIHRKFEMKKANWMQKHKTFQMEVEKIRTYLKNQKYNCREFNDLIFEVDQMKYQQKVHQKTVQELSDHNHKQQVVLSRKKKHLTDVVGTFNAVMRQIHYFDDETYDGVDLQLTLNPNQEHLNAIIPTLRSLSGKLNSFILEKKSDRSKIKMEILAITCRINSNLLPQLQSKQELLQQEQKAVQQALFRLEEENNEQNKKMQKLESELSSLQKQIANEKKHLEEKTMELEQRKRYNEDLMQRIEETFERNAAERTKELKQLDDAIDLAEDEIKEFNAFLDQVDFGEN